MNSKWESTEGSIFLPLESLGVQLLISLGSRVIHQLGSMIASAENWKISLLSDWESAIRVGVLDCGEEENYETCKEYGIYYYPTFRVSGRVYCLGCNPNPNKLACAVLHVPGCSLAGHFLYCWWESCRADKRIIWVLAECNSWCSYF